MRATVSRSPTPVVMPTAEQRRIIDYPLLPLRIAAGAGTGKTLTIVLRLATAVAGGVPPEAALGLTFTNKSAEELSARLREQLPHRAAAGHEITVTTYHGFALQILQEFGAMVGVERDAKIIGSGFQRQLLDAGLISHAYRHLDLTAPNRRVAEAANLGRQLGDNLLVPADLMASAPADADEVWEARLELGTIVDGYTAEKQRLGVLDYADLIRLCHHLVTSRPEIATRIRDRYRMVVVDEYQDTDPGQRLLLQRIFGDGFPITAVGDPDQTIYEWRGASALNFALFPGHFPDPDGAPAATLPLTLNRRSGVNILALANAIRGELHETFDTLQPLPGAPDGSVHVSWHRTSADESAAIADDIRRLHDEQGIAWGAVAVLVRRNRSIAAVRDSLESADIPVDVVSLGGLLTVPEVAELRAWLQILSDPADSAALVKILLGSRFRLGLGDIGPLHEAARAADPPGELLEIIDEPDAVDGLSNEARRRLEEFLSVYREFLVVAQSVTLSELCRRILDRLDFWAEVDALPHHAALSVRLNLYRFLDRAESWSPLEGRPSLATFLGYLGLLEDDATAEELDMASVSSDDAVSLMTVHRAKGLEWDVVFIPAVAHGIFPSASHGYDNPVDHPQFLPYAMRIDRKALPDLEITADLKERRSILAEHHTTQEWRTAYVAVTRARHALHLTGSFWDGGSQPRKPSALWELAASLETTTRGSVLEDAGERPEVMPVSVDEVAPDPLFGTDGWAEALRHRMEDGRWLERHHPEIFPAAVRRAGQLLLALEGLPEAPEPPQDSTIRTSVTGLVTLATCPRRFQWSEIDRLPRRPSRSLRHGADFHRKVELHNLGIVPLNERADDLYDLDSAESRGSATGTFERFLGSRFSAQKPAHVEVPIEIRLPDARIRGRIDAVYADGDRWEIVDYKSGSKRDETNQLVQLQAYAVAAADGAIAARLPGEMAVTFAYFGAKGAEDSTWVADDAFIRDARARLNDLVAVAADGSFPTTPSATCRDCDFLRLCDAGRAWIS